MWAKDTFINWGAEELSYTNISWACGLLTPGQGLMPTSVLQIKYLYLLSFMCWILAPQVGINRMWALCWVAHEDRALLDGIRALIKETPESSLPTSAEQG